MRRDAIADLEYILPAEQRPRGRFLAQARLPSDGAEHPYGQWDMLVEPVLEIDSGSAEPVPALMTLVSDEAPRDRVRRGARIELFRGATHIATAVVTSSLQAKDVDGLPPDPDFLPPREQAA